MVLESSFLAKVGNKIKETKTQALLKEADFDFGIVERDLYYPDINFSLTRVSNRKVLLRKDNGKVLGVTAEKYSAVTMVDALSLFDPLVEEGHLKYEYTGVSSNSKKESLKFWVLLSLNTDYYEVTRHDYIMPYILLSNSFDGSCGLWIRSTAIRYHCDNQTHLLIKEDGDRLHIKHTGQAKRRFLKYGKQWIDSLLINNQKTVSAYQDMNKKNISFDDFNEYAAKVFPDRYKEDSKWSLHKTLVNIFKEGDRYCSGKSAYAAYNSVTKILTHELGSTPASRFFSNNWSSNNTYGKRAFNLALGMLNS